MFRAYRPVLLALLALAIPGALAAQAPSAAVRDALLSQVAGFGGCRALDSIAPFETAFFPGVRFWVGSCNLEHGAVTSVIAATDSAGQVYVLDSQSAFVFLVRRHRPVALDSANALAYTQLALTMQGKLPWGARLLTSRSNPPRMLCARTRVACDGLYLSHAADGGRIVYLTAYTNDAIYSAGPVAVDLNSGRVTAAVSMWYPHGDVVH